MTMQSTLAQPTHLAYADETLHNMGRYRGIGLISLRYEHLESLCIALQSLLHESGITELKWQKLDGAKYRFAALKILHCTVKSACAGLLRADVLTWDIQDSRHTVRGRDDSANLQRMYYHLFKNVLLTRWPDGSIWRLCPDEHTGMKWAEVEDFLGKTSTQFEVRCDLFTQGRFSARLKQEFGIEQIMPCQSHQEPIIQMADLLVGLAVYSRISYDRYEQWNREHTQQPSLFSIHTKIAVPLSRSDHERCRVLSEFDAMCKRRKLGVSLKTNRGLKTFDPANPINFWWYEPQHEGEKAPVKEFQ